MKLTQALSSVLFAFTVQCSVAQQLRGRTVNDIAPAENPTNVQQHNREHRHLQGNSLDYFTEIADHNAFKNEIWSSMGRDYNMKKMFSINSATECASSCIVWPQKEALLGFGFNEKYSNEKERYGNAASNCECYYDKQVGNPPRDDYRGKILLQQYDPDTKYYKTINSGETPKSPCIYDICSMIEVRGARNDRLNGIYEKVHEDCSSWNSLEQYSEHFQAYKNIESGFELAYNVQEEHWSFTSRFYGTHMNEIDNVLNPDAFWPALPFDQKWRDNNFVVTCARVADVYEDIATLGTYGANENTMAWENASKECASRGQYLCSSEQVCNYGIGTEPAAGYAPETSSGWMAIGSPNGNPRFAQIPAGPDGNKCGENVVGERSNNPFPFARNSYQPSFQVDLFSCCGNAFPGAPKQQSTKLILLDVPELTVSTSYRNGYGASATQNVGPIYVTEEVLAEVAAEAGCQASGISSYCKAQFEAGLVARARVGLNGEITTLGGVPVMGDVYIETKVGAEVEANAGMGVTGIYAESSGSIGATATFGATISGNIEGVEVSADTSVSTGPEATYATGVYVTPTAVSFGAEASARLPNGVETQVTFGAESDYGGAAVGASACAGCVGVGFAPAFIVDGCSVTVSTSASIAVAAGGEVQATASPNFCSIYDSLEILNKDVEKWGISIALDAENQIVSHGEMIAAATEVAAIGTVDLVEDISRDVDRHVSNFVNSASGEIESFGNRAGKEIANTFCGIFGC